MDTAPTAQKRQLSIALDDDLYESLAYLAKVRRSSIAQVAREYIAEGIERDPRAQREPAEVKAS